MIKCVRCKNEMKVSMKSRMNTDIVCWDCIKLEETHPLFNDAYVMLINDWKNGIYNSPRMLHGQSWPFGYELTEKKEWVKSCG